MAEKFSCCSSYMQCSDAKKCLHADDPLYQGCAYRCNLDTEKIFYGKNVIKTAKNVIKTVKNVTKNDFSDEFLERYKRYSLYLICYDYRLIVSKNIRGFSYGLRAEEVEELKNIFNVLEVPCTTEIDESECNREGGGSRVILKMPDSNYTVSNYDHRLIPQEISKKLSQALERKGLESFVETFRTSKPIESTSNRIILKGRVIQGEAELEKTSKKIQYEYEQVSIFNLGVRA